MSTAAWTQKRIALKHKERGCHLVTSELLSGGLGELVRPISVGMCHIFIQHTSASLAICENADPDVLSDMKLFLEKLVPDAYDCGLNLRHVAEGPDDMSAHVKSVITSTTLTIPITNGRLALGTWQGVWLLEHRKYGGERSVLVTVNGATA